MCVTVLQYPYVSLSGLEFAMRPGQSEPQRDLSLSASHHA